MRLRQLLRSANFRLAAAYAGLFSVSVIILAVIVLLRTTSAMEEQAKRRIESESAALQTVFHKGGLPSLLDTIQSRQRSTLVGGLVYSVFDGNGAWISGPISQPPAGTGWSTAVGPPDGDEEPGELERLTVLNVQLSRDLWLSIGDDFGRIAEYRNVILEAFAWSLALTLALAIGGGLVISANVLRRIATITDTAEAIMHGDIHKRIPRRAADDELDRLGTTLNDMLDRIVALMAALREVSNNIAHELRTPLSHLRQTLEHIREAGLVNQPGVAEIDGAIEESEALLSTFSALLRIAQIESGTRRQKFTGLDLSALVTTICQTYVVVAEEQGRTLVAKIAPGIAVRGDGELLAQLLVNLIENSLRHTPPATAVTVALTGGDAPALIVCDNGLGIPLDQRQRALKRFERLERTPATPGTGLGLSIVEAIANLHQMKLELLDNAPGLKVKLSLIDTSIRAIETSSVDTPLVTGDAVIA